MLTILAAGQPAPELPSTTCFLIAMRLSHVGVPVVRNAYGAHIVRFYYPQWVDRVRDAMMARGLSCVRLYPVIEAYLVEHGPSSPETPKHYAVLLSKLVE